MVQVDVFWSYAIGAGFALAAARQLSARALHRADLPVSGTTPDSRGLRAGPPGRPDGSLLELVRDLPENPFFTRALLFLALIFGPSGVYLLWAFTSWETMHVGDRSLPAWLVAGFAITNVTQGILGFLVAYHFIRVARPYLAYLQLVAGYSGMLFILVHGWDGTGYQRFFSPTREAFLNDWTWSTAAGWLTSDVAFALYGMGVVLLPVMLGMMSRWIRDGVGLEAAAAGLPARAGVPSRARSTLLILASVLVAVLGSAIGSSLLIRYLGWLPGGLLAIGLVAVLGVRRGGYFHRLYESLMWLEPAPRAAAPADAGEPAGVSS